MVYTDKMSFYCLVPCTILLSDECFLLYFYSSFFSIASFGVSYPSSALGCANL